MLPSKIIIGKSPVSTNADGLISLTDLWKAGGQKRHQHPGRWTKNDENIAFIGEVARKLDSPLEGILTSRSGRAGSPGVGTFAHWQIALAYAKYLPPELHMAVNEVFMRYKAGDPKLAEEVIDKVEDPAALERIERRARVDL